MQAPANLPPANENTGPAQPWGKWAWSWTLLWAVAVAAAVISRPVMPVDETRYLSVAWDMWSRSDWLVPYLNGEAYSHKPPLLFWLMHAGWALFGVNDITPRLVAPLFALGSLFLSFALARRLWPGRETLALRVPFLLLASVYWTLFSTMTMFDMLVGTFALMGLWALVRVRDEGGALGWFVLALAIGGGGLAKGPAVLLYVMPVALLAPWWDVQGRIAKQLGWVRWYAGVLIALVVGVAIALAWAWPAGQAGGEAYRNAIFFGQTAGRVVNSFAHQRPVWWYVAIIIPLLLPMMAWPKVWRGLANILPVRLGGSAGGAKTWLGEHAVRFCLVWFGVAFVVFSFISGKQPHYLIPVMPAAAMLIARALDGLPVPQDGWQARTPAVFVMVLSLAVVAAAFVPDDILHPWMHDLPTAWGLLGLVPAVGLFLWRHPSPNIEAGMANAVTTWVVALHLVVGPGLMAAFDFSPVARHLAELAKTDAPIAHIGKYRGEYHFLGRFNTPLEVVGTAQAVKWARENPNGYIVYHIRSEEDLAKATPEFVQTYRTKWVAVRTARQVASMPELFGAAD